LRRDEKVMMMKADVDMIKAHHGTLWVKACECSGWTTRLFKEKEKNTRKISSQAV